MIRNVGSSPWSAQLPTAPPFSTCNGLDQGINAMWSGGDGRG